MKKLLGLLLVLLAIPLADTPRAADIGSLAWNQANIATLRSFSKADLLAFFNEERRKAGVVPEPLTANEIAQFEWADLANNGQYQLVLTLSEPCAHAVDIEKRNTSGKVTTVQTIGGFANLKTGIRDLNGDGRDELIIARPLVEYSCAAIVTWAAVYRLESGKYVEASRDFPRFYDEQVLPKLEERIAAYQSKRARGYRRQVAAAILQRDKVLRVLGRNPAAGLNQAYQWMNTDDPYLLLDAEVTLKEIGGHQEEVKAAELAYTRADCERHPAMVKCRNLPRQAPRGAAEPQIESHAAPQSRAPELTGGPAPPGSPQPGSGARPAGGTAVHGGGFIH
jgi:hypothetical protein